MKRFWKENWMPLLCTLLAAMLIVNLASPGATLAAVRPASPNRFWQVPPQALSTTLTNVASLTTGAPNVGVDLYVCQLAFSIAPGTSAVNITVETQQNPPVIIWNAIPLTPTSSTQGTLYVMLGGSMPDGCYWFPGGMAVQASASGVSIAAMSGRF
jgi:hypothetical protein